MEDRVYSYYALEGKMSGNKCVFLRMNYAVLPMDNDFSINCPFYGLKCTRCAGLPVRLVKESTKMRRLFIIIVSTAFLTLETGVSSAWAQPGLIAHWELTQNGNDKSGNGHHLVNHNVGFAGSTSGHFNGVDSWLELPPSNVPNLWKSGMTISAWVNTEQRLQDVIGDVLSCYDLTTRTGVNLSIMNYAGVTNAQSNHRNVFLGWMMVVAYRLGGTAVARAIASTFGHLSCLPVTCMLRRGSLPWKIVAMFIGMLANKNGSTAEHQAPQIV